MARITSPYSTTSEERRAIVDALPAAVVDPEQDPATWTITGDGFADGGTPYTDDELRAPGYQACGCYVGEKGAVVIRCAKHGAEQWHDGGNARPKTHPWEVV